jgi:hypothetical protein
MSGLTCYACGATAALGARARCDSGEAYWLATDPAGFEWPAAGGSLWRYRDLLPDADPTGLAAAVGWTR